MAPPSYDPLYHIVAAPYKLLRPPKLRLKLPTLSFPSPMVVYGLVLVTYFLVVSGFVFDVINSPPGIGSRQDPASGRWVPQVILAGRLNQQYIIEGLSSGFMFVMGGLGVVLIDMASAKAQPKQMRLTYLIAGVAMVAIGFSMSMVFLRIKVPGYLR